MKRVSRFSSLYLILFFTFINIYLGSANLAMGAPVPVTLRMLNQNGTEIPGSTFYFGNPIFQVVHSGGTINLEPGNYGVYLRPGTFGQAWDLNRYEYFTVSSDTREIVFEWLTVTVPMNLKDGNGANIPGSTFYFGNPFFLTFQNGDVVTLPVIDRNIYPNAGGDYQVYIRPGTFGRSWDLNRLEHFTISTSAQEIAFEWLTVTAPMNLKDGNGTNIPGSTFYFGNPFFLTFQNGDWITLPVIDRNIYPNAGGDYQVYVRPGIIGQPRELNRLEHFTVSTSAQEIAFEWPVCSCPLAVVDSSGTNEVIGATFALFSTIYNTGSLISLPITINDYYPGIGGDLANGYAITLNTTSGSGTFNFEVNSNATYTPPFVTIGASRYGLRCMLNNPPSAAAGDNRFIYTYEQPTTVINGIATDPDGGLLTYRWYEGENMVQQDRIVGLMGEAPLNLGGLPTLNMGDHNFILEVSDVNVSVRDSVIVTVGNSPPAVAGSGGGTFQVGIDNVVLNAMVSDFDGDLLQYSWKIDAKVISSGEQMSLAGGEPIRLPSIVLNTGQGENNLGIGSHQIILTVNDGFNNPASFETTANVVDTQHPTLAPSSNTAILWPPNHKMIDVTIYSNAWDNSGLPITLSAEVSSSEDPDKDGDGHTIPDFTKPVIDQNTGIITLQLRSERSGKGKGRIYTITITAKDSSDNTSTANVEIKAPRNK